MPARSGSARRYADALFSLAVERGTIDTWAAELERVARVVSTPGVVRLLDMPGVELEAKRTALQSQTGVLSREVLFVVNLLLERRRIELLPALAEAFAHRVRQHRGIAEAEITTAVPLGEEELRVVVQRIEQRLGQRIEPTTRVDPDIIGGVVVRVGDQLFDASVRGRLERLRRRLAQGAGGRGPERAAAGSL
jgi:F-type H+-transporting ATPase subunit delta